jgi:two-component system response regulator YesN
MSNIRVFIVDDEDLVRNGLKEYVQWYEYCMEVVGTAEDGQEAFDYLSCHDVELVVSDIYMPKVDGLELIEKLKSIGRSPVVILISGHSSFEYAKRAIKSEMVFEYILKPVNFEELDKVLSEAKEKILKKESSSDFPILTKEEWSKFAKDEKGNALSKQIEILNEVKLCDLPHAKKLFNTSWEIMIKNEYTNNMIARYCIELNIGLIDLVLEQRNSREVLLEDPIHYIRTRHELFDIKAYVMTMLEKTYNIISRKEKKDLSPIINVALDYINENYNKHEQSLNSLADHLNVSPNYLCLRFKEETGINYTKYLNNLRVKHAKDLLRDVRLKIYMISDMVGFEDTRYFSRIFRTYTGYTPTEYQKKEAIRG